MNRHLSRNKLLWLAMAPTLAFTLAACETNGASPFKKSDSVAESAPTGAKKFTERDVEAPEIFQKAAKGLWDGRPSLGGVWVAHTSAKDPERVIIRNQANGKFVIGALFRKSKGTPGPDFQVSSDAASALGMPAGTPIELSVTAMKIEKKEVVDKSAPKAAPSEDIASTALEALESADGDAAPTDGAKPAKTKPPKRGKKAAKKAAAAPVEAASTAASATPAVAKPAAKVAPPKAAPPKATGSVRYAQLGLFSVESNAKKTLADLKAKGLDGKIVTSSAKGKTFHRVLAGPASTKAEQSRILGVVKGMGFADAYLVKG